LVQTLLGGAAAATVAAAAAVAAAASEPEHSERRSRIGISTTPASSSLSMDAVAPAGLAQRIGVKRPRQQTGLGAENGVNGAGTSNTSNTNTLGAMKTSMSTSNLSSMGDFHAKNDFKRSASSGNLSSLSEGAELSSNRRRLDIINERRWSVVQDLALGWAVRGQVLENVDFESVARQLGHEHSARECRERAMDLKTKYRNAPWEDHEDDRLQHQMSLPGSSLEVIASTAFPWRTPDQIKARWTYLQEQKKQEEQQKQQRQDEQQQKKLLDAADEEQNRKAQQQQLELLQKLLMQQQNQQQHVSDEDSRKNDLLRSILQQNQQQQHQQSQQQTNSLGLESGSSQGTPQPMSGLSKDSDVSSAQFQMLQQFKADQENLMRKLELNQQMNAVLVQETARLFAQLQKQQQTSSTGNTQNQNIHMGPPISASSKNNSSNSLSSLGSAMALQARRPSGGASLATSTSPSPTQTPPDSPKPLSAFFSQVRQQQQQSRGNSNNTGVRRNTNPIPNTSCSSLPLPEAQALFVQLLASQQQKQSPSQQQQQQQQPKPSQLWGSSSSTSSNHDAMDTSSDSADSAIQLKHHLLNQMLNPDLQRTLASRDAQAYLNQGYSAANQTPDNQTQTYGLFSNPAALAHALSAQMQRSRSISSNDDEMEDAHSGKDLQHNVPKSYSNGRPISGAVPGTENTGRWTTEEHARFLSGIAKYGTKHWTAIANVVKTRTVVQVRTHAQKFFKKRGILRPNADPDMARAIVEESVAAIANGKSRSPSPSSDL